MNLERVLQSIGKKAYEELYPLFVDHWYGKLSMDELREEVADRSPDINPSGEHWTPGAVRSRISCARRIFRHGLEKDALVMAQDRK